MRIEGAARNVPRLVETARKQDREADEKTLTIMALCSGKTSAASQWAFSELVSNGIDWRRLTVLKYKYMHGC